MLQQINKKILVYFFLFLLLATLNNKSLSNFNFPKISSIEFIGLGEESSKFIKNFELFKMSNIFFLDKLKIKRLMDSNNTIEEYTIFKRYPSTLEINVIKTKFLAYLYKDGKKFYIGSNGKLIEVKSEIKNLPYIFGDLNINEFLKLKKTIDKSNLNYNEIKNLFFFPSGRWDIEKNSGILIKLPNKELKESLKLSLSILNNNKFGKIKTIDVRQKNQVIINEQ